MWHTIMGCLVWDDPSKIKDDVDGGNKITVFSNIMMILDGNDFKSLVLLKPPPNPVIRYLSSRLKIQDHSQIVILD